MGAITKGSDWIRRRWFPIALVLVVFAGYGLGKDRAMTENNLDAAAHAPLQQEG